MNALADDNDSTLPDISVYQTPVLEASRCGERKAERRRELRVARREQHPRVHVAGAVILCRGGRGQGLRVEEQLGWTAGLGCGPHELSRLLPVRKPRRVNLERVAHRPRDSRASSNDQGL